MCVGLCSVQMYLECTFAQCQIHNDETAGIHTHTHTDAAATVSYLCSSLLNARAVAQIASKQNNDLH